MFLKKIKNYQNKKFHENSCGNQNLEFSKKFIEKFFPKKKNYRKYFPNKVFEPKNFPEKIIIKKKHNRKFLKIYQQFFFFQKPFKTSLFKIPLTNNDQNQTPLKFIKTIIVTPLYVNNTPKKY